MYTTHFCLRTHFSDLLPSFQRDYSLILYPYSFPQSVSLQPDILASLFSFTCCSVKTVHLHFLQITTSHEQHCSAEKLQSLLSTLAAVMPSTSFLSPGLVTQVFQQLSLKSSTPSLHQEHFTSILYSFYLALSSIQNIPLTHSLLLAFLTKYNVPYPRNTIV